MHNPITKPALPQIADIAATALALGALFVCIGVSVSANVSSKGSFYFAQSYFSGGQRGWLFWLSSSGTGLEYMPGLAPAVHLAVERAKPGVLAFRSIGQNGAESLSYLGRIVGGGGGWFEGGMTTGGRQGATPLVMRRVGRPLKCCPRSGLYSSRHSVPEAGDLIGVDVVLVRTDRGAYLLWEDYEGRPTTPLAGSDVKLAQGHISFRIRTSRGDLAFSGVFRGNRLYLSCQSQGPPGGCPRALALKWKSDVWSLLTGSTATQKP